MVAALIVSRHGPASSSAALRKIAARSSKDSARQPGAAARAASIAAATSASVALPEVAEDLLVVVRLHDVDPVAAAHPLLAADRHGQLGPLAGQLLDPGLQRGALGAARRVGPDRLVDRRRNVGDGIHAARPPCAR